MTLPSPLPSCWARWRLGASRWRRLCWTAAPAQWQTWPGGWAAAGQQRCSAAQRCTSELHAAGLPAPSESLCLNARTCCPQATRVCGAERRRPRRPCAGIDRRLPGAARNQGRCAGARPRPAAHRTGSRAGPRRRADRGTWLHSSTTALLPPRCRWCWWLPLAACTRVARRLSPHTVLGHTLRRGSSSSQTHWSLRAILKKLERGAARCCFMPLLRASKRQLPACYSM